MQAIVMKSADNVATAIVAIPKNSQIEIMSGEISSQIQVLEDIPFGHKFALRSIPKNSLVIKYGEVIGVATEDILPGRHTHVHNIVGCRGRGDLEQGEAI